MLLFFSSSFHVVMLISFHLLVLFSSLPTGLFSSPTLFHVLTFFIHASFLCKKKSVLLISFTFRVHCAPSSFKLLTYTEVQLSNSFWPPCTYAYCHSPADRFHLCCISLMSHILLLVVKDRGGSILSMAKT